MAPGDHIYHVLVVSSSEKLNEAIRPLLSGEAYGTVTYVGNIASAKRAMLDRVYDFVMVNAPLPDDFGTKFAMDISAGKSTVCLMLVKAELFEEIYDKVTDAGVFLISRPTSSSILAQSLRFMATMRERLRQAEKKTLSMEEKMEEIRTVNRAKWVLIETLKMTESDAHRYIEKQAMDRCITKRELAEEIIRTYR